MVYQLLLLHAVLQLLIAESIRREPAHVIAIRMALRGSGQPSQNLASIDLVLRSPQGPECRTSLVSTESCEVGAAFHAVGTPTMSDFHFRTQEPEYQPCS